MVLRRKAEKLSFLGDKLAESDGISPSNRRCLSMDLGFCVELTHSYLFLKVKNSFGPVENNKRLMKALVGLISFLHIIMGKLLENHH